MTVSAVDKSTGKVSNITITNDKGRLSKDEIEKLVKDAEKYKAQDDEVKKKVEAKNGLENYCYSVRNTLKDDKVKDKIDAEEQTKIETAVDEALKWVEANPGAHAEEYESQQKTLEGIFNPIVTKLYGAGAGGEGGMPGGMGGMPGGFPGGFPGAGGAGGFPGGTTGGNAGPKVDEVD